MKRATLAALIGWGFIAFCFPALAVDMPVAFQRGLWETSFDSSYFNSTGNYISGSGYQSPLSGTKYYDLESDFSTRYVFTSNWSLFGNVQAGYANSTSLDQVNRSATNLNSGTVGAQFMTDLGALQLIPEFSYLFAFTKNSETQNAVMTSEGVNEMRFILHLQAAFKGFTPFGYLGYDARSGGRSNLVPWGAGVDFNFGSVHVGGSLYGFNSVSNDGDTGNGEFARNQQASLVNGGTMEFYSVNPSVVDSELYLCFGVGRNWRVAFGGGAPLSGSNTAAGYHGEGSIIYSFSTVPIRRIKPHDDNVSKDPYVDDFHEDTNDGVDQNLFRPPAKPRPAPPNLYMKKQQPDETKATATPEDAAATKEARDQQKTQQDLDNAEMSVELKSEKKHKKKTEDDGI